MQAIEVRYKGFRFRSRLEARWAVFFDALGIEYEYEPEGFRRGDILYLPDFRVKCAGVLNGITQGSRPFPLYVEVKGNMDEDSAKKIKAFGCNLTADEAVAKMDRRDYDDVMPYHPETSWKHRTYLPILVVGDIPYIEDDNPGHCVSRFSLPRKTRYDVEQFSTKHVWWYDYDEHGEAMAAFPGIDEQGNFVLYTERTRYDLPILKRVKAAYNLARSARFEHGANMEQVVEETRQALNASNDNL